MALSDAEIESAFRLRYEVFVEEERNLQLRNSSGLETDKYDAYCDHLIVKDLEQQAVVGTYRLLPGDRAADHIGFYSESEFDLTGLYGLMPQTLELGRSCIAPEYRNGRAISLLWEGILSYAERWSYHYMIGCASIPFKNREDLLQIYTLLRQNGAITDRYGIKPLETHRIDALQLVELADKDKDVFRKLPPLMKGYQWLGAEIGGDPAYDPLFDTVDYFVVLNKERLSRRYQRRLRQS
ncbi:MAG: hypothetical protein K0R57_2300 [Paenibacillaceae bacterium]|nr:hypothetical protein [Paenibacillaceae bacterium]